MSARQIDHAAELESTRHGATSLGFWIYLMTDIILFSSLFATFMVLRDATYGGPGIPEIASMPLVLIETLVLLASSFTAGMAMLAVRKGNKRGVLQWLAVTFVLGATFVGIEIYEFHHIVASGWSWQSSAFLTAFFTLVGTHGAHIIIGLIWILSALWRITGRGLTRHEVRRMNLFSLYWHFLDLVWIFIFTVVYLMGVAV